MGLSFDIRYSGKRTERCSDRYQIRTDKGEIEYEVEQEMEEGEEGEEGGVASKYGISYMYSRVEEEEE